MSLTDLETGATATLTWTVEEQHCTTRGEFDIFSTPNLVLLLELAAMDALAPYLREDQASVGATVDVSHVAPTLRGQQVTAVATVTEVDRRLVRFSVEVGDDVEVIGRAVHDRFVVDVPALEQRLAAKRDSLRS